MLQNYVSCLCHSQILELEIIDNQCLDGLSCNSISSR